MKNEILNKINLFLNEEEVGSRPIQFLKWYKDFRPGDRADMESGDDYVNVVGTNANGNFAGIKKNIYIEDGMEVENFKALERDVWNYC